MLRSNIITGLDIGTNAMKILVVQRSGQNLDFLAKAVIPSFGLRKGVVVNIEETSKNIQILLSELQKTYDKKINSAFANIGGGHLYLTHSHGLISVSRADGKISQEDIERVLQAAQAVNLPSNQEILDVFPTEFIIDDQKNIREPLGLIGKRLEAKVLLLISFSPYLKNLSQALFGVKIQIDGIISSPLAAARSALTPQQKELGVVLIDIGAATTSLAVFEEGDLIHFAVFPIGSANITNDIAIGLRTEIETAEKIKKQFGTCILGKTKREEKHQGRKKIEISDKSSPISFSHKILVDIIEARVFEIFALVQKELRKISRQELLPAGAIITGGGAKLPKIVEIAKKELKLPCRIGVPKGITGLEEDPSLATVAGLVLEGVEFGEGEAGVFSFAKGLGSRIKRIFRSFIP